MLLHYPAMRVSTGRGYACDLKPYIVLAALREVAEYLAGQTLSVDVETVTFAMHFPRFVDIFYVSERLCY